MNKATREFWEFLREYSILQLAVAVVIGNAAKDLVNSIAANLIMPLVGMVTPGGNWRELNWRLGSADFKIGLVIGSLLDFVILAGIVFVLLKKLLKMDVGGVKKKT